jgi:hypothetical protein
MLIRGVFMQDTETFPNGARRSRIAILGCEVCSSATTAESSMLKLLSLVRWVSVQLRVQG